jgi:hypothetical protein
MFFVSYLQHNTLRGLELFADVDAALHRAEDLWASGRMQRVLVETAEDGALVAVEQAD